MNTPAAVTISTQSSLWVEVSEGSELDCLEEKGSVHYVECTVVLKTKAQVGCFFNRCAFHSASLLKSSKVSS